MDRVFKVDGDTVVNDSSFMLAGPATVVGTPGNHGDLGGSVDTGEDVAIPSSLGRFGTTMRPIPSPIAGIDAGGMIGCIAVVMEEDSTPDQDIANGHAALNQKLQEQLDAIIPTLGLSNQTPTEDELAAIQAAIQQAVYDAIAEGVDFWDVLGGLFGNLMDDEIGIAKWLYKHDELDAVAGTKFPISRHWSTEGSWTLEGEVRVDKELVAGISRSGDWGNVFLYGRTTDEFMTETQQLFDKDGLRMTQSVHCELAGKQVWAGIWLKGDWAHAFFIASDLSSFLAKAQELYDKSGLRTSTSRPGSRAGPVVTPASAGPATGPAACSWPGARRPSTRRPRRPSTTTASA